MQPRFFAPDSFWNQPLAADPAIDPESDMMIASMQRRWGNLYINSEAFTMPVFEAEADTPRQRVRQRSPRPGLEGDLLEREARYRQHPDFAAAELPIPDHARPDPANDEHMAVVDRVAGLVYDMWRARRCDDGSWESSTGMVYPLDGSGLFAAGDFAIGPDDSIHFHGPSRAAGVPIVAGLIMEDELRAGVIEHKLALACSPRHGVHAWPAIWTDGGTDDGGIEGAILQLDPGLDLDAFPLPPAARCIAEALQRYGAVCVDGAGGNVVYAESLHDQPGRSWDGLLDPDDLRCIPIEHCRWLACERIPGGDPFWRKRRIQHEPG